MNGSEGEWGEAVYIRAQAPAKHTVRPPHQETQDLLKVSGRVSLIPPFSVNYVKQTNKHNQSNAPPPQKLIKKWDLVKVVSKKRPAAPQ